MRSGSFIFLRSREGSLSEVEKSISNDELFESPCDDKGVGGGTILRSRKGLFTYWRGP